MRGRCGISVEVRQCLLHLVLEEIPFAAIEQIGAERHQHVVAATAVLQAHAPFLVGARLDGISQLEAAECLEDIGIEGGGVVFLLQVELKVLGFVKLLAALGSQHVALHAVGVAGAFLDGFGQQVLSRLLEVLLLLQRVLGLAYHAGRREVKGKQAEYDE